MEGQITSNVKSLLGNALSVLPVQYQRDISHVSMLESESNLNFCLHYSTSNGSGGSKVLRLQQADTDRLGLDLDQEIEIYQRAQVQGLSPQFFYANASKGVMLTEYCAEKSTATKLNHLLHNSSLLAGCLSQFHQLNAEGIRVFDIEQRCLHYYGQLDAEFAKQNSQLGTMERMEFQQQLEFYQFHISRVFSELSRFSHPRVLCHNDLNPANLLLLEAEQIKFIDFEYSAVGDPLFDFALLSLSLSYTDLQLNDFLDAYNQSAKTDFCLEEVKLMQPAVCYLQWMWYLLHDPHLPNRVRLQTKLNQLYQFEQSSGLIESAQ